MEFHQLKYFICVVEEGNISAAARKLNMTQPPLSTQIRLLEQEIGNPLFVRGPREIRLTDTGKLLYERARNILSLAERTMDELENQKNGIQGRLRLGAVSSVNEELLWRYICPMREKYRELTFELFEANTYQLIDKLRSNLLDLALIRTPFPIEKDLLVTELWEDPILVAGKSSFFSSVNGDNGVSMKELSRLPLIVYRRWKSSLDQRFAEYGEKPAYLCVNDDARTSLSWARAGLGVTIVPKSALRSMLEADPAARKDEFWSFPIGLSSKVCAVTNRDGYQAPTAELFLRYIQNFPGED